MKRSILAAAVLVGFAGFANADPLVLSSAQMDKVSAGQFADFDFFKRVVVDEAVRIQLQKNAFVNVIAYGTLADGEAIATCSSFPASGCTAETLTNTYSTWNTAGSASKSVSATGNRF